MWRVLRKPIQQRICPYFQCSVEYWIRGISCTEIEKESTLSKSVSVLQNCSILQNTSVPYDMQQRSFSSTATRELQEITNNSKLHLLLQSGKYKELIQEIEKKYKDGYYLSRNDFSTIVNRFTEFEQYALTNDLYSILKDNGNPSLLELAPLFSYNYLLSGDIQKAFSLISYSSDQYLSLQKEARSPLPQEYLFVRICIQLVSDILNLDTRMDAFSQSLPRRTKTTDFAYSQSIVNCYMYSWKYLTTAIKQKQGLVDETPSHLKELFATPYSPITGDSRALSPKSFSSFTTRFAEQRLQSTLHSLELLLWFYYSRSVFDLNLVDQEKWGEAYSFAETIDTVYETMKDDFEFWNQGIFQFFLFHFSQPVTISSQIQMKNEGIVRTLLKEMKERNWHLSLSLMKMLLTKKDMKMESLQLLISFFINKNQSPAQLQSFIQSHSDVIITYAQSLSKRNAKNEFRQFIDELFYLNAHLPDSVMSELVLHACYLGDSEYKQTLLHRMNKPSPEAICGCILEGVVNEHAISSFLDLIDSNPKWSVLLQHILMTVYSRKKDSTEGKKMIDFCHERNITLSGLAAKNLFQFYKENRDYQNIIHFFYVIKREHIMVDPSLFKEMESTAKNILKSKSRLLDSNHLLDVGFFKQRCDWLPRANSKYNVDKAYPPLRHALALLKQDESAVSVNQLMESVVREYCKTSILQFGCWM